MVRRLTALLALVAMIALALTLLWRVYGHHVQNGTFEDSPTVVRLHLDAPPAENFANAST